MRGFGRRLPSPPRVPDRRAARSPPCERRGILRRHEQPRLAVGHDLGIELTAVATTGRAHSIASSSASPNPSQRAGWTTTFARRSHQATSPTRPGSRPRRRAPISPPARRAPPARSLAEHDELRGQDAAPASPRARRSRRPRPSGGRGGRRRRARARRQGARAHPAAPTARAERRARSARPEACAGKSHDVPVEARESLGDADDERRLTGEQPLEIAPFPGAKRIVVVLRRDEHRSGARAAIAPYTSA